MRKCYSIIPMSPPVELRRPATSSRLISSAIPPTQTKEEVIASKKVTAKAEPMKGTFTMLSKSPKVWGARINGKAEKGQRVILVNRYGGMYEKVLVEFQGSVPANEFTGQPAGEVWTFTEVQA